MLNQRDTQVYSSELPQEVTVQAIGDKESANTRQETRKDVVQFFDSRVMVAVSMMTVYCMAVLELLYNVQTLANLSTRETLFFALVLINIPTLTLLLFKLSKQQRKD